MSIVKRSNALLNYSNRLSYYEGLKFPSVFYGFNYTFGLAVFGTCLFHPILNYLMYKYFLPKTGEGPSEKTMNESFLRIIAYG